VSSREQAIVVGAGLGGLYAACRLAHNGISTVVLEKRAQPGGYCSALERAGYTFDIGATMLQTPEVLAECFEELDRDMADYIDLIGLDPIYRVSFPDGTAVDFSRDVEVTAERLAQVDRADGDGFRRYVKEMDELSRALKRYLIDPHERHEEGRRRSDVARIFARLRPWLSVEGLMRRYFRSDLVRMAMSFQTLYFGSRPDHCPAMYGMVPYFEVTRGVWYARGGINAIAAALARVLEEYGGRVETRSPVAEIMVRDRAVRGVRLASGEVRECTRLVSNAEATYTYQTLVPRPCLPLQARQRLKRLKRSCSNHLTLLGVRNGSAGLDLHHTFLLPRSLGEACRSVFELEVPTRDFWAYVADPSKSDASMAPEGRESLYVLVPGPFARTRDRDVALEDVLRGLERRGVRVADVDFAETLLPEDFQREFNQPGGMGFGIETSFTQSGPLRVRTKSPYVRGLYLAGASTAPGAGIPLVLSSGRSAALNALADAGMN
jgi:phytoene desaturase